MGSMIAEDTSDKQHNTSLVSNIPKPEIVYSMFLCVSYVYACFVYSRREKKKKRFSFEIEMFDLFFRIPEFGQVINRIEHCTFISNTCVKVMLPSTLVDTYSLKY